MIDVAKFLEGAADTILRKKWPEFTSLLDLHRGAFFQNSINDVHIDVGVLRPVPNHYENFDGTPSAWRLILLDSGLCGSFDMSFLHAKPAKPYRYCFIMVVSGRFGRVIVCQTVHVNPDYDDASYEFDPAVIDLSNVVDHHTLWSWANRATRYSEISPYISLEPTNSESLRFALQSKK